MTACQQVLIGVAAAFGPVVTPLITNRNLASSVAFPGMASAGLSFDGITGDLTTFITTVGTNQSPEWDNGGNPDPLPLKFYIKCTVLSGSAPEGGSSAINTFILLSGVAFHQWSISNNTITLKTATWRIDISWGNPGVIVATATYTLSAASVPP